MLRIPLTSRVTNKDCLQLQMKVEHYMQQLEREANSILWSHNEAMENNDNWNDQW